MKKPNALFYFLKVICRISWQAASFCLSLTLLKAASPIVNTLLSAKLLGQLTAQETPHDIGQTIFAVIGFNLAVGLIQPFLAGRFATLTEKLKDEFCLRVGEQMMALSYGQVESAAVQDLRQQALLPITQWGCFEFILNRFIPDVLGSLLAIAATFFLVLEYSLFLLLPILLLTAVQLWILRIKNRKFQTVASQVGQVERKLGYYDGITSDFSAGKDIRLFQIDRILMKNIQHLNDEEVGALSDLFSHTVAMDFWGSWVTQFQIYLVYFIEALALYRRTVDIGGFFRITGLFINFGNAVFRLAGAFADMRVRVHFLEGFLSFEQLPVLQTPPAEESVAGQAVELTFQNVSFAYSGAEPVLKDVSFSIPAGKSAALVGVNGSGKSTIAKLATGLLIPDCGQILIDKKPLTTDGRNTASAVYQDYQLFAFTIRENVETAFSGRGCVTQTLLDTGLSDVVNRLKEGADTYLYQAFHPEGIDLSGGQSQKLAAARALYKDAGLIILDEPTSAYDAKAEAEIFQDFQKLIQQKTALLISHRLASCRFCDEILVMDGGRIAERGTHTQLMQIEKGRYREMFLAQAEYYN